MTKPKIIVTRAWPAEVEAILVQRYDAVLNDTDTPMDKDALRGALQHADALCSTVTDDINQTVLDVESPRARIIGNFGVGFNHIDMVAARSLGLTVTNTPDVLTNCTADLAMLLLLMTARRAGEGERMARSGTWSGWRPTSMLGTQVSGKTLGIVGLGRIGAAVAARAHYGFDMQVLYYNRVGSTVTSDIARRCASLEQLLGQSDFVSLHCPGGPASRHLIDAGRLRQMRSHAILINTARGDVLDEKALVDALRTQTIAAAGLDVFAHEPNVEEALSAMDNVVLLPHLGSATRETRVAMGMCVVKNLDVFFAGGTPPDQVV